MQITESLSHKIKVLPFWAMISVLFIHSNTLGAFEVASWNVFLQRLLTRSLSSWAVPFFFMVSGFWFANGNYDGWSSFLQKSQNITDSLYLLGKLSSRTFPMWWTYITKCEN